MAGKTIKVIHILEGFAGGLSTYVCTVLPQLVQSGFEVTLLCSLNRRCSDADVRISKLRREGVKVYVISMSREISLLRDICSFAVILRFLLENKFDIVHTHCSKAGALGRVAAVLAGVNIRLHSPHCFAFQRCGGRLKRLVYLTLERQLGRLTTRLVAVGEAEADAAIRLRVISSKKIAVVRNGLSESRPFSVSMYSVDKADFGIDKDSQVVTTACRLAGYKGLFRFLQAAKMSRSLNAVFLIAGEGELRGQIEEFVSQNGLANKVKLAGYIADMEQVYAISDMVVLCCDAEAQPYLLLEAMRARLAIVATSVPGNKELITSDKTGVLVEPRPACIARAIDELLADKKKRDKYAGSAYAYFRKHHLLGSQVSKLIQIYGSCVCNGQE